MRLGESGIDAAEAALIACVVPGPAAAADDSQPLVAGGRADTGTGGSERDFDRSAGLGTEYESRSANAPGHVDSHRESDVGQSQSENALPTTSGSIEGISCAAAPNMPR